jgi:F-type H+-transporting ATPase subunit epsilon
MAHFAFELVSPERQLFSGQVVSVIVPGADGEFQVYAGHAPVMSTLNPGVVTIDAGTSTLRMFVMGGFADVNAEGLTLLAEQAIDLAEVKAESVAQQIKDAQEDLADAKDEAAKARVTAKLAGLGALMKAVSH